MTDQECGCAPVPTQEETKRLDRWLKGGDVEGFPRHDLKPFRGYVEQERVVISMSDLQAYRHKNRLTLSERLSETSGLTGDMDK